MLTPRPKVLVADAAWVSSAGLDSTLPAFPVLYLEASGLNLASLGSLVLLAPGTCI